MLQITFCIVYTLVVCNLSMLQGGKESKLLNIICLQMPLGLICSCTLLHKSSGVMAAENSVLPTQE